MSTTTIAIVGLSALALIVPVCASERPECPSSRGAEGVEAPLTVTPVRAPAELDTSVRVAPDHRPPPPEVVRLETVRDMGLTTLLNVQYDDGTSQRVAWPTGTRRMRIP